MRESRLAQRVAVVALVGLLVAAGIVSFDRARRLRFDFDHFYRDACYVWEHGVLNPEPPGPVREAGRQLPFYLPAVPLLLAPLAAGGPLVAAVIWSAGQVAALAYGVRRLAGWSSRSAALLVGIVAALPALYEAARFNQLTFLVLALILAGLHQLERGRAARGGVLFGLAAGIKLLPAIFLVWLLAKRQWRAAGAFVAALALFALVPCLLAWGPARTWQYHREWWEYNVGGAASRGLVSAAAREHFINHQNQSIPAVVARWCWPEHPYKLAFQPWELDLPTCTHVAHGIAALLAVGLVWLTRRSWSALDPQQRRGEVALYALAMLILAPLLRQYYLAWALPALVVLAQAALCAQGAKTAEDANGGPLPLDNSARRSASFAWLGLAVWGLTMLLWMSEAARAAGATLFGLVFLAAAVIAVNSGLFPGRAR